MKSCYRPWSYQTVKPKEIIIALIKAGVLLPEGLFVPQQSFVVGRIIKVYSYFEKGCRKKIARDDPGG